MKSPSILIVDDEPLMRMSMMDALKASGYDVNAASAGNEGLEVLNKDNVDILITDLRMPGISGLEVLQVCKQRSPRTEVIMITAHGSVDTAVGAMKMGAYDYITKPFHMREIKARVSAHLGLLELRGSSKSPRPRYFEPRSWKPSGSFSRMVCSMTRGPAKPMSAPGSAM